MLIGQHNNNFILINILSDLQRVINSVADVIADCANIAILKVVLQERQQQPGPNPPWQPRP